MNVGVNYMREHMPSDARIHYAYLDAGGIAPNVVQAKCKLRYVVRATMVSQVHELLARVRKIADGSALMTETSVTSEVVSAMSSLLANAPLEDAMQRNLDRLGPPPFDEEDVAFARRMQKTVTKDHIETAFRRAGLPVSDFPLCDTIAKREVAGPRMAGSTDVGDVSWAVPTVQAHGATYTIGTPGHSWQLTAHGQSPLAHKGMVHVAKIMAGVAVDALVEPGLLEQAKKDFAERLARDPYKPLLPEDAKPPIHLF
jgi:aminobenzoyl-glutamate utilization protein B